MRKHHLGLICSRLVRGVRAALLLAPLAAAPADALYSAGPIATVTDVHAARFEVSISPTPVVQRRGQNMRLEWTAVTISSGAVVRYTVLRHGASLTPVEVCTGGDAPVTSGSTVTCMDRRPGQDASYTVQAYVTGHDGSPTWSLPVSSPGVP